MSGKTLRNFWSKNKATGPAVKAPIGAKSVLKKLEGVPGHTQLKTLVAAYENIDPATDPDCSQRMTALRDVDAAIYKWFDHTRSTKLSDVKGAKAMASLLKKAEQAHEQLVDAVKDDATVLPFDTTNLSTKDKQDREAVWRKVVDGTGEIKLGGSDKFQKKTRAQVAKMLQTETGFNILNYLAAARTDPADPKDRIVLGDKLPTELKGETHMTAVDADCSYAKELSSDDTTKELKNPVDADGNEDPAEYPTLTQTAQLQQAIFAGAKGVIVSGKKYAFGPGSGSFVKTVPPRAGDEDSDTAGAGNTEIITPAYVTLAHELGHAVNIRAGASTRKHDELMKVLCKAQDPSLTDDQVVDCWTNSEEYFNISNIENGMRRDVGLPQRTAHKPRSALAKMALIVELKNKAAVLQAKDETVAKLDEAVDLAQYLSANKGKTDDPKVVKQVELRIDRLSRAATDAAVLKYKRKTLTDARNRLDAVYKTKRNLLPTGDPLVKQYTDLCEEIDDDFDTIIALGTKTLGTKTWEMQQLRFALDKVGASATT